MFESPEYINLVKELKKENRFLRSKLAKASKRNNYLINVIRKYKKEVNCGKENSSKRKINANAKNSIRLYKERSIEN